MLLVILLRMAREEPAGIRLLQRHWLFKAVLKLNCSEEYMYTDKRSFRGEREGLRDGLIYCLTEILISNMLTVISKKPEQTN